MSKAGIVIGALVLIFVGTWACWKMFVGIERNAGQRVAATIGHNPDDPPELQYIDPNDWIHSLSQQAQIEELKNRKATAFRVLSNQLTSIDIRLDDNDDDATDSDGERGYIKLSNPALVPRAKESLCSGRQSSKDGVIEFDATMRRLRRAGLATLLITSGGDDDKDDYVYTEIMIGPDGRCMRQ
ncbi:MAG TPA: hypothetical protein VH601_24115 [Bryobacteraceae bacterium]|jgi:hypothetical protein